MKFLSIHKLTLCIVLFLFPQKVKAQEHSREDITIYLLVDKNPKYFGGDSKQLLSFIAKNLNYPNTCMPITGTVYIEFVIEKRGKITNIKIMKSSVNNELDKEAVRVIKLLPPCTPAEKNGVIVRTRKIIPVRFGIKKTNPRPQTYKNTSSIFQSPVACHQVTHY
jgi:TonB family protein